MIILNDDLSSSDDELQPISSLSPLEHQANSGIVAAQIDLAKILQHGDQQHRRNPQKAFQWAQKAAESRHPEALHILARCYLDGVGTEKNIDLGYGLLKEAAFTHEHPDSMATIANCWLTTHKAEKTPDQAKSLFKKAAKNGSAFGMFKLAICYDKGIGTTIDQEKALLWYEAAADNGIASAAKQLGDYYKSEPNSDPFKAFEYYSKAAESGMVEAMVQLSYLLSSGTGCTKNQETAREWMKKAADRGHSRAQNQVGHYYKRNNNMTLAVKYWTKCVRHGKGVPGSSDSAYQLGIAYQNGKGVDRNLRKAFLNYKQAANDSNYVKRTNAIKSVMHFLRNGMGVNRNDTEMRKWQALLRRIEPH
ncbi:hypothetical protein P9112_000095 [Eukaryota sp. TZLM1-RC]